MYAARTLPVSRATRSDLGVRSVRRVIVVRAPGRANDLHRTPLATSLFSTGGLRRLRAASLGRVSRRIPGFCVPSCKDKLASTTCVHNVNSHVGAPTIKLCISGINCTSGDTCSVRLLSIRHVSILHKPRTALCNHNAVNNLVHIFAHGPFLCRNASVHLNASVGSGNCRTALSRCKGTNRHATCTLDNFCGRSRNFFHGVAQRRGIKKGRANKKHMQVV